MKKILNWIWVFLAGIVTAVVTAVLIFIGMKKDPNSPAFKVLDDLKQAGDLARKKHEQEKANHDALIKKSFEDLQKDLDKVDGMGRTELIDSIKSKLPGG